MAKQWTKEENELFVEIMSAYRKATINQNLHTIKQITEQYVSKLLTHPLLIGRTRQAVHEHLTYFDDLLEGIGTTDNYGRKDGVYFGKLKSGMRETQHPLRVLRNRTYYLVPPSDKGVSDLVWINVDIPQKFCTIHADRHCTYVRKMTATPFKGIDMLKRDGGWISFENTEEANRFCQDQYAEYKLIVHC